MEARSKADDPAFRIVEYVGIDDIRVTGPTGRAYHLGEDPEEIRVAVHHMDLNYLRALGLIKMKLGMDPIPVPKRVDGEFRLIVKDGMVIGCENHGLHIIEDGKRRCVPDLYTQHRMGMSMEYAIMLPTKEFLLIPEGKPMPVIRRQKNTGRQARWVMG